MNRSAYPSSASLSLLASSLLAAALLATPARLPASDAGEDRVTRSAQGPAREREPNTLRDPLVLKESRTAARDVVTIRKGTSGTASVTFGDSWIYDATAELFYDLDGDGYYHYLRVWLDADTIYEHAIVYAVLYLSADGELWEEYFVTDDFDIYGGSPDDAYEVETELVAGYPAGLYDVLIELYDAEFGLLVDQFGPAESAALELLPLEDARRDGVEPPTSISDGHGGGGAISWGVLIALLASVVAVRRFGRSTLMR